MIGKAARVSLWVVLVSGCDSRVNHCSGVICDAGWLCQPVDGTCVAWEPPGMDAGPGCSPPCTAGRAVCDTSVTPATCRVCTGVEGCGGLTPLCDTSALGGLGACVLCTADAGCSGATPRCDTSAAGGQCVGCLSDADCPAGIGRCSAVSRSCVAPDGGPDNDDCSGAAPLTFGDGGVATAQGDTRQATNGNGAQDGSPSCSQTARDTGQDVVYRYALAAPQDVTVAVTPTSAPFAPVVYVRSPGKCASGLAQDELSCDAPGMGKTSTTVLANQAPGTYFVWVDGAQGSAGTFSIAVSLAPPNPPPPNISCATAAALAVAPGGSVTVRGTTRGAPHTVEPLDAGSPSCSATALENGADVVYSLALSGAQDVTLDVTPGPGRSLWPVVFVRGPNRCASTALADELACDDPVPSGEGSAAHLSLLDLAAGTYSIWISGESGTSGDFALTAALSGPTGPPANDGCAGAQALSLPAAGVPGTTWGASNDANDPCSGVPLERSGPDVVYAFTTAQPGRFVATVTPATGGPGTLFPVLSLRAPGDCAQTTGQGSLGCVVAPNAGTPATLVVSALPAGSYDLVVDGYRTSAATPSGGPFTLDARLDPLVAPVDQNCGDATQVALTPGPAGTLFAQVTGQTGGGGTSTQLSCGGGASATAVYLISTPAPGTGAPTYNARVLAYSQNDDEYVPALSLRTACANPSADLDCQTQSVLGGAAGAQAVALALGLNAGTTLSAWLGSARAPGTGGSQGPFVAELELAPTPAPNDACAGAIALSANASQSGTTLGAANDADVGRGWYGGACAAVASSLQEDLSGAEVFYAYTAAASGQVTVTVQPERGYDAALALLGACGPAHCAQLSDVPLPGAAERVSFTAAAGATYYLVVDGYAAAHDARGGFVISVAQ